MQAIFERKRRFPDEFDPARGILSDDPGKGREND